MSLRPPIVSITSNYEPLGSSIRVADAINLAKQHGHAAVGFVDSHPYGLFYQWQAGQRLGLPVILGQRVGDQLVFAESDEGLVTLFRAAQDGITEGPGLISYRAGQFNEFRYTRSEDRDTYRALRATAEECTLDQIRDRYVLPLQVTLGCKDSAYVDTWAWEIFERCKDVNFRTGASHMPVLPGVDPEAKLKEDIRAGLRWRYGSAPSREIRERAAYEYRIIKQKGYCSYFLVVAEYVQWANQNGILSTNRGSGAGSLAAYALGITHVDPMEYGLLFERFLNPERPSMPDFDIDFAEDRRQEVIDHVIEKYGIEYVRPIITRGTIKGKAALRDAARALGHSGRFGEIGDRLSQLVPPPIVGRDMPLWGCFDERHPRYDEAGEIRKAAAESEEADEVIKLAIGMEGATRQWGQHACGVAMADVPLAEVIPMAGSVTGCDWSVSDSLGVPKMDMLGLRNLTVITDTLRHIRDRHGLQLHVHKLPLNDSKTYEMLQEGLSLGVFQLEGAGMRSLLRLLKPTEVRDLNALVALYRPGPMGAGTHTSYARRKNALEEIEPIHPELAEPLEEVLGETYGLIVYQEQVLRIAQVLAGYSLGRADVLRKALGKKSAEVLAAEYAPFRDGMLENGYSQECIDTLWEILVPFADYSFNKAHATAYGHVAYYTAWLKAHYPVEYMAALMTSVGAKHSKLSLYLAEARWMGIDILPPDVDSAVDEFLPVSDTEIRFGMAAVHRVGEGVAEAVVAERNAAGPFMNGFTDYHDLDSLFLRMSKGVINKAAWENLIKAGALDEFGCSRQALLEHLPFMMKLAGDAQAAVAAGLGNPLDVPGITVIPPDVAEFPQAQRLAMEKAVLGLYITGHPLDELWSVVEHTHPTLVSELEEDEHDGTVHFFAGIVGRIFKKTDREGKPWAIFELEDPTGTIECLVFSSGYPQVRDLLTVGQLLIVKAFVRFRDGTPSLYANDILLPGQPAWSRLEVTLEGGALRRETTQELLTLLETHQGVGDGETILFIPQPNGKRAGIRLGDRTYITPELVLALSEWLGSDRVSALG